MDEQIKASRLKRYTVPIENQWPTESQKKWLKVTEAILSDNQDAATNEKTILEDEQRRDAALRKENNTTYVPKFFTFVWKSL